MTTALLIDDNPTNLNVLDLLLRQAGVQTVLVTNPARIDSSVQGQHFDLIFLDLEFPNHSGLDLVKQLKADPRFAGSHIAAYTVHTSEQNEARDAGFDSFLGKPLDVERFPQYVEQMLKGQPVWVA